MSPQNLARTPAINQQPNIIITPVVVGYTCLIAPIKRKINPNPPIRATIALLAFVDMVATSSLVVNAFGRVQVAFDRNKLNNFD